MSKVQTAVLEAMKYDGHPTGYISDLQFPKDDSSLSEAMVVVCIDRTASDYRDISLQSLASVAHLPVEKFVAEAIERAERA